MVFKTSSLDVYAPAFCREPISDEDLIRGFILALGAVGRKEKTLYIYEESIRMLSEFARIFGLPGLSTWRPTVWSLGSGAESFLPDDPNTTTLCVP